MPKTTYDLVSRGKNVTDMDQCWGTYNSTTQTASGPGYENSCIHSGTIRTSGDLPTTWYNYALATAGTIASISDTNTATESVCPKGWTLPDSTQMFSIAPAEGSATYIPIFSPVLGGSWYSGGWENETKAAKWWGNGARGPISRFRLGYSDNVLNTSGNYRNYGNYIRCVQKST